MSRPSTAKARPVILFVDDDQLVLDGLAASLRRLRSKWSMEFVCGGAAGIARLGEAGVDVVVTDMRMPGTDGEAVLMAARQRCPSALRIVLSGQTDREVVRRTIGVAHQFLSKPCTADELRECLERLLALTTALDERTREVVCSVDNLPVSPIVLAQLSELLAEQAPRVPEIVACIESDAAMTAKLLYVASAGFFVARQKVKGVHEALLLLGLETTAAVLLSSDGFAPDARAIRLALHARATGQLLIRMTGSRDARLCGVLHDLGKVVLLARYGDAYAQLLSKACDDSTLHLHELEQRQLGMSHDTVGAYVLGLWGIPEPLTDAIRSHCDPRLTASGGELAALLHLACALTQGSKQLDPTLLADEHIAACLSTWRAWAAEIEAGAHDALPELAEAVAPAHEVQS